MSEIEKTVYSWPKIARYRNLLDFIKYFIGFEIQVFIGKGKDSFVYLKSTNSKAVIYLLNN